MYIYHKQCEIMQKIRWNSSNGQLHWFLIDFLWISSKMDQTYPNANASRPLAKFFKRYPGMPYESWRPAVSENVVHHRTIFRFSVGDLIYLVFQRSQPWSLSIYPEGVDGRMKVHSSMIIFWRLGRDQTNSWHKIRLEREKNLEKKGEKKVTWGAWSCNESQGEGGGSAQ